MKLRFAVLNDLSSMTEIYNQAISLGQRTAHTNLVSLEDRKEWFYAHNNEKYPILVAEKDGVILGYLSISPYRPGRAALRYTAEVSYYVHLNHLRRKVATQLLQKAIDICPQLDIKTLFAILIDTNQASIGLLEKFGFKQWGHMPNIAEFEEVEVGHLYFGLRVA